MKTLKIVWFFYSACGVALILAAVLLPSQTILEYTPTCYSIKQYGRECFMCGSTRSFLQAGEGNFKEAINLNSIAFALFCAIALNTPVFLFVSITNFKKQLYETSKPCLGDN